MNPPFLITFYKIKNLIYCIILCNLSLFINFFKLIFKIYRYIIIYNLNNGGGWYNKLNRGLFKRNNLEVIANLRYFCATQHLIF